MPDLQTFLEKNIGFSKREISTLDTSVLVKEVSTTESAREIAIFGIVRINISQDCFLAQFRRIGNFMESEALQQIGTFNTPPQEDDLAGLVLPKSDLDDLAKCEIGDCKVKLPAEAFDHLKKIDWSEKDSAKRLTDFFRTDIVNYVRTYLENGNPSLMVYADKKKPMALADGFDSLLAQASYVYSYIPELYRYLQEFPRSAPSGVDNFFYWSMEDFGQRPTMTVTHATIYERTDGVKPDVTIALKLIYASHYFKARLELMGLVDASTVDKKPGFYLVYLDRMRFDENLNRAVRLMVRRGVQSHIRSWLTALRERLQDVCK